MFKKTFLLFLLIIAAALGAGAMAPGSWKGLPMAGVTFDRVADTPDYVYYVTGGALYSYDKKNNETTYYAPGTKISDCNIRNIQYNDKAGYLLCLYDNNNIDLIYDNGKIVNFPDIKDAKINGDKTVNAISFGDGRIYVAAVFGLVVYDDNKHVVLESGIYNKNVMQAQEFGDNIIVFVDYYLHYSPKSERHNTFDKFTKLWNVGIESWQKVDENSYLGLFRNNLTLTRFDIGSNSIDVSNVADAPGAQSIEVYKDGYFCVADNGLVMTDKEGKHTSTLSIPQELADNKIGMWTAPSSVWAADTDGIGNYNISDGSVTVLSDKYRSEASNQFNTAYSFNSNDGTEVYFNGIGNSTYHPAGDINSGLQVPLLLESYNWQTGEILPRYPQVEKQFSETTQDIQNGTGLKLLYGGPGQSVADPVDPSIVYHANNFDGLIVLKDCEVYYHYDKYNSPIATGWGSRTYGLGFDNMGNLWVAHWSNGRHDGTSPLKVLSKESLAVLRQNPEAITEKDASGNYKYWQTPKWIEGNSGWTDGKIVFAGNYGVYTDAEWNAPIVGIDTKGTADVSDDKVVKFTGVVDQDGNVNTLYTKTCFLKDNNNNIWLGTSAGVYIIRDVRNLADDSSPNLSVVRPKVPRNDGTNYADYLLDSDEVICMALDPTNRKWIGTVNSGLFLVNENGTEILAELNKDNSPLVSNTITMVACDPKGNDVLVGTKEGLFVYSSDASPAAEDYSEIYAYPNPVRPEYSGSITIKGLMDDSLVKIADVQGNVIWNGRSEGGLAVWDGCDAAGNRVRSGVYMVYASQNASGSSSGAVTKIVVIN